LTRWGLILLLAYLVLGLGRLDPGRAVRYAVWMTVLVLVFVGFKNGAL
jgi:hypothetical protein